MKKFLVFLNVLLVGIIVFMARNSSFTAGATYIPIDSCQFRFCEVDSSLSGMIDGALLKKMSVSYASDPGKSRITGKPWKPGSTLNRDGLSMVFDVNKLKTLIWKMYNNACLNHCDTSLELGIRFYYIKYPSNTGGLGSPRSLRGLGSEVANKHALVMVPCYRNNKLNSRNREWHDYDLFSGRPGCFNPIDTNRFNDPSLKNARGIAGDLGDNHGGVGPPPETGIFPTN